NGRTFDGESLGSAMSGSDASVPEIKVIGQNGVQHFVRGEKDFLLLAPTTATQILLVNLHKLNVLHLVFIYLLKFMKVC
ncbi:MAG: hypothetical protein HGB12_17325, partial [Bacteroidetes bacterium]|nr:hypothetical protein [Bacteroidota bacterium]